MLERLQKKLYLSVKLNSGSSSGSQKAYKKPQEHDLLSILFFGSGAVRQQSAQSDGHTPEDFAKLCNSSLGDILQQSKELGDLRRGQLHHDLGEEIDDNVLELVKAEEKKLLQGVTQVQTRLFEGKLHHRSKTESDELLEIAKDMKKDQKGDSRESTAVESKHCEKDGEDHETYCILCRGHYGGDAIMCTSCPRSAWIQIPITEFADLTR